MTKGHLTCIAMRSSSSRFTVKTRSTLYVARVVFTVGWTMNITVNAVKTDIATTLRNVHEYALHSNMLVVNNVVYKKHGICDLALIKKIKCRYTITQNQPYV